MVTGCATCSDCGKGIPTGGKTLVEKELCVVFCQARKEYCELRKTGKTKPRPSEIASEKMKDPATKARMRRALERSGLPKGASALSEKPRPVAWNKPVPKSWNRAPMTGARLQRMLAPVRERVERQVRATVEKVIAGKLAKKAATAWLKFIPVINVISTAYDIYDIASTGYDLYKMVDEAMSKYSGKVFEIRPDVTIQNPDGSAAQIYDFKFEGDRWRNGQKELYDEAVGQNNDKAINQEGCKCI